MNVLLTGATGFLGYHIYLELKKYQERTKNLTLHLLVRETSDISRIKEAHLIYGDLLNDQALDKALGGIDVVINAAASTPNRELSGTYQANTLGVNNLVKACRKANVKKILHISSISVTFNIKGKYATTKKESEEIIIHSGIPFTIFRPTGIYGSNSRDFAKFVNISRKIPFAVILGSGEHLLQPVYVKDVAKAVSQVLDHNCFDNKIYTIAGPEELMFKDSISKIHSAMGIKRPKLYVPKPLLLSLARIMELFFPRLTINPERVEILFQHQNVSISEAVHGFGYSPVRLEVGLKETIQEMKAYDNINKCVRAVKPAKG